MNLTTISEVEMLIRLLMAALFGAIIGLERERKDWAAGLRTHMMVCVGAALVMLVSTYGFNDVLEQGRLSDPSRIAAQVVSGIGFIGAGTIMFQKQGIVRGITTAAGLWTVAAIGLAAGSGMYFAAAATTALAIVILLIMQPIERRLTGRFRHHSMRVTTINRTSLLEIMNMVLQNEDIDVLAYTTDKQEDNFIMSITFKSIPKERLTAIVIGIQTNVNVKEVIYE